MTTEYDCDYLRHNEFKQMLSDSAKVQLQIIGEIVTEYNKVILVHYIGNLSYETKQSNDKYIVKFTTKEGNIFGYSFTNYNWFNHFVEYLAFLKSIYKN